MKKRNITLSLPEDLLKRLKVVAALRDTSVTELIRHAATRIANEPESYQEARDAMMADISRARDIGTKGSITWSRDSLHDREALR